MTREAPEILNADTGVTSSIWNNQVARNLLHLLALKMNGTPLTSFADGADLDFKTARLVSGASLAGASPVTITNIPTGISHLRLIAWYKSTESSEATTTLIFWGGGLTPIRFGRSAISLVGNTVTGNSDYDVVTNALYNASAGKADSEFCLLDLQLYAIDQTGFNHCSYVHRAMLGSATNDQKYIVGSGTRLGSTFIDNIRIGVGTGDFASGSRYWLYGWSNAS